jgi:hypothetical protein
MVYTTTKTASSGIVTLLSHWSAYDLADGGPQSSFCINCVTVL